MRDHVLTALKELAKKDKRIYLFTGDLGYIVLDDYKDSCPNQFINIGIAEQNMTTLAAGMAKEGNIVFTYSIGNFPTLRCVEQIRNDVCYHNLNVKILAVGGGFVYGNQGITHHATEDIAIMRALPNMRVYVPGDAYEAVECLKEAYLIDGPAYIRLARNKEQNYHYDSDTIDISKLVPIHTSGVGFAINIIVAGSVLCEGVKLLEFFRKHGVEVGLFSAVKLKPLDIAGIQELAKQCKLLVTIEDHQIVGGLGGAVAEAISNIIEPHAVLYRAGLNNQFSEKTGSQEYLRDYYGISANKLFGNILDLYNTINAREKLGSEK